MPAALDPVPAAPETPARLTERPLRAKPAKIARKYRVPWADLLQKVFAIDVLASAGRLEVIAFVAEAAVAKRILDLLGLASQAPPLPRARSERYEGAFDDPGPDYQAGDPIYND